MWKPTESALEEMDVWLIYLRLFTSERREWFLGVLRPEFYLDW